MSGMKSWSTTAGNNVLANTGFTMDEGMAPSTVNDSVRQLMADVRTEWAQGASIASAATVDLSTSTGGYVTITGSTGPITSFGTVSAGIRRRLLFTGTPTITYNATSMITPTAASIVVVAGDTCEVISEGSGNWRFLWYGGQRIVPNSISAETAVGGASSSTSIAHGLGAVPSAFFVVLRCKTAELGYSIGDEVACMGDLDRFTVTADATNVVITIGSAISLMRKDTFTSLTLTLANWKYVLRAYK